MYANEQYSVLPRALCNEDGNLHKANKSNWSDKLASRYELTDPPVLTSHLPCDSQIIIDAMFIFNMRPLRQTKTIAGYCLISFYYHTTSLESMKYTSYLISQEDKSLTLSSLSIKGEFRDQPPMNTNTKHLSQTPLYPLDGRGI